ncbi:MAG: diguanylate cyclase [Rhodoferax sp.]
MTQIVVQSIHGTIARAAPPQTMQIEPTILAPFLETPPRPSLLVVDDQPISIQVMHQIFGAQYHVFMATGGHQALAHCRSNPPDLVLLDVVMPDMDGFAVCAALKADPLTQDIPIIFVTGHTDAAQETRGLEVGAVDFISKPVNPAVVRARVKTHLTLKFQSDLMRKLVFLDGLTGVYNRRYFDQQLAREVARAARTQTPLSLIMLDVDYFKRYNDRYGHQAGDDCLRQMAQCLKAGLRRPADLVARYGGEEFVCVLPDTPLEDATSLAQGLLAAVRALGIAHADSDAAPVVTISLGVASQDHANADPARLLALADAQLYRAKSAGRAQVSSARLSPPQGAAPAAASNA